MTRLAAEDRRAGTGLTFWKTSRDSVPFLLESPTITWRGGGGGEGGAVSSPPEMSADPPLFAYSKSRLWNYS